MFLTRLILTLDDYRKFRITDDYSIHRVVYSLFPKTDKQNRILYTDRGLKDGFQTIFILSKVEPTQLSDWPLRFETKPVEPGFLRHTCYSFEIFLNPVRKDSKTGKLKAVLGEQNLRAWFLEKAEVNGFTLTHEDQTHLVIYVRSVQKFHKDAQSDQNVIHNKVQFSGTLTVTDPERFRQAFEQGIGKAKAFGFGLLQIVPIFD